ncbi:hypothetical protein OIU85_013754 [Salix viminalis]|uniref:Uncharacterized protein n=1 Tax=Salix viminalis TaxID=40686 RepID=A0A9Q0NMG9_SALVM|nr:hypothetical protein OIU85_013754 [Salix viminalis]
MEFRAASGATVLGFHLPGSVSSRVSEVCIHGLLPRAMWFPRISGAEVLASRLQPRFCPVLARVRVTSSGYVLHLILGLFGQFGLCPGSWFHGSQGFNDPGFCGRDLAGLALGVQGFKQWEFGFSDLSIAGSALPDQFLGLILGRVCGCVQFEARPRGYFCSGLCHCPGGFQATGFGVSSSHRGLWDFTWTGFRVRSGRFVVTFWVPGTWFRGLWLVVLALGLPLWLGLGSGFWFGSKSGSHGSVVTCPDLASGLGLWPGSHCLLGLALAARASRVCGGIAVSGSHLDGLTGLDWGALPSARVREVPAQFRSHDRLLAQIWISGLVFYCSALLSARSGLTVRALGPGYRGYGSGFRVWGSSFSFEVRSLVHRFWFSMNRFRVVISRVWLSAVLGSVVCGFAGSSGVLPRATCTRVLALTDRLSAWGSGVGFWVSVSGRLLVRGFTSAWGSPLPGALRHAVWGSQARVSRSGSRICSFWPRFEVQGYGSGFRVVPGSQGSGSVVSGFRVTCQFHGSAFLSRLESWPQGSSHGFWIGSRFGGFRGLVSLLALGLWFAARALPVASVPSGGSGSPALDLGFGVWNRFASSSGRGFKGRAFWIGFRSSPHGVRVSGLGASPAGPCLWLGGSGLAVLVRGTVMGSGFRGFCASRGYQVGVSRPCSRVWDFSSDRVTEPGFGPGFTLPASSWASAHALGFSLALITGFA